MELNTARTTLSALQARDIPQILKMYKEEDSFMYIHPLKDKSLDFYRDFLLQKIEKNKKEIGFWVVKDKTTHEVIGTVSLNNFFDTEMIQVGCHLGRKFWNQGYAYELLQELTHFGKTVRKLPHIYGVFQEENTASQRLMEKLHFSFYEARELAGTKIKIYRL